MWKSLALNILKPLIGPWLHDRALHVPNSQVDGVAKRFGVDIATWRAIEVFMADEAETQIGNIIK